MNDNRNLNKRYAIAAWGALFLLLGALMVVPGDQSNLFVLLSGIVLLGLNLARVLSKIAINPFSITLGFLALGLGAVGLLGPALHIPHFEIPFVPLVLLVFGLYLLIPGPRQKASGS
jgi:hypothetical protein